MGSWQRGEESPRLGKAPGRDMIRLPLPPPALPCLPEAPHPIALRPWHDGVWEGFLEQERVFTQPREGAEFE